MVAIVGRPNVGKSAIFNRIAGKRIAIVHDESGVTRDRLMREVDWDDAEVSAWSNTGGVMMLDKQVGKNPIEVGIRAQVDSALGDAAVAILVVDVQQGMHPLDEEVADIVRKAGVPCVWSPSTSVTSPSTKPASKSLPACGFPCFPVAAQHNRGFGELMEAVLTHPARSRQRDGREAAARGRRRAPQRRANPRTSTGCCERTA